jgi:aminoglycoside phosphotransferase (APT) family kinase protein
VRRASQAALRKAFALALQGVEVDSVPAIVARRENVYESTHRSEVLECPPLPPILCKYGPVDEHDHLGLRHGLAYEADVYRSVLDGLPAPPRFFGSYVDSEHRIAWLFLEYLDEGWQLDLGPETAIVDAAAMLGELHRLASERTLTPINHYDEPYFRRCLEEANAQAARWRERVPSFPSLAEQFDAAIPRLVTAPQTVVHGEFTPHNVVWAHEQPRVVDWEQAAVGAGEIDLAALTDDWEEDLVELATQSYVQSRWACGPDHDFEARLAAARLYWLFRWLSDPEQAGTEEEIAWLAERASAL